MPFVINYSGFQFWSAHYSEQVLLQYNILVMCICGIFPFENALCNLAATKVMDQVRNPGSKAQIGTHAMRSLFWPLALGSSLVFEERMRIVVSVLVHCAHYGFLMINISLEIAGCSWYHTQVAHNKKTFTSVIWVNVNLCTWTVPGNVSFLGKT